MPAINAVKNYRADSFYHIYNRGFEKSSIFLSKSDYAYFLKILERYSFPTRRMTDKNTSRVLTVVNERSMHDRIKIHAFCLLPNHYHLLIHQKNDRDIAKFMSYVGIAYAMYFNKKYARSGYLFQGRYRGVLLPTQEKVDNIVDYIHKNPVKAGLVDSAGKYVWSSCTDYLKITNRKWVSLTTGTDPR